MKLSKARTAENVGTGPFSGHTPGPWRIIVPPTGSDEIRGGDEENSYLVCELPYGSFGEPEASNASLIAAAPDLLAALQLALAAVELNTGNGVRVQPDKWPLDQSGNVDHEAIAVIARAALAKVQP